MLERRRRRDRLPDLVRVQGPGDERQRLDRAAAVGDARAWGRSSACPGTRTPRARRRRGSRPSPRPSARGSACRPPPCRGCRSCRSRCPGSRPPAAPCPAPRRGSPVRPRGCAASPSPRRTAAGATAGRCGTWRRCGCARCARPSRRRGGCRSGRPRSPRTGSGARSARRRRSRGARPPRPCRSCAAWRATSASACSGGRWAPGGPAPASSISTYRTGRPRAPCSRSQGRSGPLAPLAARDCTRLPLVEEGRVVVVTGGAGAIGTAVRRRFAATGDRPVGIDLRAGDGVVGADVASEDDLAAAFAEIRSSWGPPTVLVHAAGITGAGTVARRAARHVEADPRREPDLGVPVRPRGDPRHAAGRRRPHRARSRR